MQKSTLSHLLVLVILSLGLAACSKSGGDNGSSNGAPAPASPPQLTWDQGNWNQKNWQ